MSNSINKQQTSENMNMLNLTNMEQYSLQSTSSNEIFSNVSSSIIDLTSHNYEDNINFSIQHSKSQLDEQTNNIITLDNDIIEANIYKQLNKNINYINIKNMN